MVVSRADVAKLDFTIFAVDKMNSNVSWNLNQTASYPFMNNRILCGAVTYPLAMTSLAIHMLPEDALRIEQFFKHASYHPTT